MSPRANLAVFLTGPIGVGKTSLGRRLAHRLQGAFLDGDEFSAPDRPWYACIRQTCRNLLREGLAAGEQVGSVVIAYPLRRTDWVFFKRSFEDRGVRTIFVGLRASYAAMVDEGRGRSFSDAERDRIRRMIAEGYDARPFSDLTIETDGASFDAVSAELERQVRSLAGL